MVVSRGVPLLSTPQEEEEEWIETPLLPDQAKEEGRGRRAGPFLS